MDMEMVNPNTYAWAIAQLCCGSDQLEFSPLPFANEVSQGEFENIAKEIPPVRDVAERSLLIFSEQLRSIGGIGWPLKFPGYTQTDQEALNNSLHTILNDKSSGIYATVPSRKRKSSELLEDYSCGTFWWTTPQLKSHYSFTIYDGRTVNPVFKPDMSVLGSILFETVLREDCPTELSARITEWQNFQKQHDVMYYERHEIENIIGGSVLRIDSATDFINLTEEYPLQAICKNPINRIYWEKYNFEVLPHWSRVAQDYAGVSIGVSTYLEHSWIFLTTKYGRTQIAGWIPEVIYLLR